MLKMRVFATVVIVLGILASLGVSATTSEAPAKPGTCQSPGMAQWPVYGVGTSSEERIEAAVSLPLSILGGGSSQWWIDNTGGTTNGLPTGGSCNSTPGLGIWDASIPGHGDAFDNGFNLWVNNSIFVAPPLVDLTGTTLTAGPVSMSGLQVTMQYYAAVSTATLRTVATFQNAGTAPVTVPVTWTINVGSDCGTILRATSSGDLVFNSSDRWLVTSDAGPWDPVNTHVLWGPGGLAPFNVTQTVYNCACANGVLAEFMLTVPAGGTQALMFFNQLNPTVAGAIAAATGFDANPAPGSDLLAGLTPSQLAAVANWSFGPLFSNSFYDDYGRSQFCVNFKTGDYKWNILSGAGAGTSYTGVGNVLNGGQKVYSRPGAPDRLNFTYDAVRKRAYGYFLTAAGIYSALADKLTTNDPPGCL